MALVPAVADSGNNYGIGGMNFLQLVQRLRQECGVSGSTPATVANLTGEMARLASWVSSAWVDIQSLHPDWQFMRQPIEFDCVAGKQSYNALEASIGSFGNFLEDGFSFYPQGQPAQEAILPFVPYEDFRQLYQFGPSRTMTGRPAVISVDPQKRLLIGPIPDAIYTIVGEGYALPTELVLDTDRPNMPSQFHMAIVYRAMMLYGSFENAPEVYQHGQLEFTKVMGRLHQDQLPRMTWGEPLV